MKRQTVNAVHAISACRHSWPRILIRVRHMQLRRMFLLAVGHVQDRKHVILHVQVGSLHHAAVVTSRPRMPAWKKGRKTCQDFVQ